MLATSKDETIDEIGVSKVRTVQPSRDQPTNIRRRTTLPMCVGMKIIHKKID